MNLTTIKKTSLMAAMLCFALNGSQVLAQPFQGHRDGPGMIEHMAERLDLTDAQVAKIKEINENFKSDLQPAVEAAHDARSNLDSVVDADTFDETAIRNASKEFATADEELAVIRGKLAVQVKAVLTDEQKAKSAEFRKLGRHHKKW